MQVMYVHTVRYIHDCKCYYQSCKTVALPVFNMLICTYVCKKRIMCSLAVSVFEEVLNKACHNIAQRLRPVWSQVVMLKGMILRFNTVVGVNNECELFPECPNPFLQSAHT